MKQTYYLFLASLALVGAGCFGGSVPVVEALPVEADLSDMIVVTAPLPNATVSSPLEISGQARGPWYFEASFLIDLVDANGVDIGTTLATADGEWMTEEFVPFLATMEFIAEPTVTTGELVFHKENPSGDPVRDAEFALPVVFDVEE